MTCQSCQTPAEQLSAAGLQEYSIALKMTELYGCSITDLGWLASSVLTESEGQS